MKSLLPLNKLLQKLFESNETRSILCDSHCTMQSSIPVLLFGTISIVPSRINPTEMISKPYLEKRFHCYQDTSISSFPTILEAHPVYYFHSLPFGIINFLLLIQYFLLLIIQLIVLLLFLLFSWMIGLQRRQLRNHFVQEFIHSFIG